MRSPRIYYLHPLLAGAIAGWPRQFDRIARLGFDHVLLAPVFLPGGSGSILQTADYDRLHPALGDDDAQTGIVRITAEARTHGLTVLLDVRPTRAAAGSPAAPPTVFGIADEAAPLDPRRYGPEAGTAQARTDTDEAVAALAAWWTARLVAWTASGIAGFRFIGLSGVPSHLIARIISDVRRQAAACRFLAWTPGLGAAELDRWRGVGLDFVFSSLPWWDFRGEWLWDEADRLHRLAPLIASPEAPFGTRLAATCRNPWQLEPLLRRAIGFAAASGAGWLMPIGFEYATVRRMDPWRDAPEDLARMAAEAPFALTEPIIAANDLRAREPLLAQPEPPRLLGAPDGPVLTLMRRTAAGADGGTRGVVLALNADLAHRRTVSATAMNVHALDGIVPALPDGDASLQPGETLLLPAEPATPIRREPTDPARAALAAARQPRLAIEAVSPAVDAGAFPAKRIVGEAVTVEADVIADGHDVLAAVVLWRPADEPEWREGRMQPLDNDRWRASFPLRRIGLHEFVVEAWRDAFGSFRDELEKKQAAGVDTGLELIEGRRLIAATIDAAAAGLRDPLTELVRALEQTDPAEQRRRLLSADVAALMREADPRKFKMRTATTYRIVADRPLARFASWYELFPRSMSDDAGRHGTFLDVIRHLPRIRDMGFDVLYFPPIHPIGRSNRKGRNNSLRPAPDDPGSPYAIGSDEGGHDAIHPELGSFDDFRRLRDAAREHGLEIAIDFAIQCSPDHPWLQQHKDWFAWRPDGSLRYAENPPKKYEDIVNVDFYAPGAVPGLWQALCDVVLFWAGHGVRIFRVDNPHTKPLPFWEWLLAEVTAQYPDAIFLAEAFTRPKMMYRLAKIGFTQSYTYFTWRNEKRELREYIGELTTTAREFFRPNFFVNTPDINPVFVQQSGRPGFLIRAALASTLSGLWGLYNGFELGEARALPGREEYADSEKYQISAWDWDRPGNIVREIAALNRLRRANPALQSHLGTTFLNAFNDSILYYERATPDRSNVLLLAVSLDPYHPQEADFELPLWSWGLPDDGALEAEDLLQGSRFVWHGKRQRMRLDPQALPFAVWRVHPAP